jgi:hypothetical protein
MMLKGNTIGRYEKHCLLLNYILHSRHVQYIILWQYMSVFSNISSVSCDFTKISFVLLASHCLPAEWQCLLGIFLMHILSWQSQCIQVNVLRLDDLGRRLGFPSGATSFLSLTVSTSAHPASCPAHSQSSYLRARGGGLSSTRGLGPTMTARGLGPTMTARDQSIGISIGMLPQTLIISRLDQLSRLGARIQFFHYS